MYSVHNKWYLYKVYFYRNLITSQNYMNSCKLSVITVTLFLCIKKEFHSYSWVNHLHENFFPKRILICTFPLNLYASTRTLIKCINDTTTKVLWYKNN